MGPKKWEHTNGMQEYTNNNMELTRAPLDRVKTALVVGNYEIETSNEDGIKYHESHCATSKLQAPTKEMFKNDPRRLYMEFRDFWIEEVGGGVKTSLL